MSAVNLNGQDVTTINTADAFWYVQPGKYYRLEADIELDEYWYPSDLNAVIDGNGHTITLNGAPLWSSIGKNAVIQNLGIKGSAKSQKAIGAIAESCEGLIVNCWSLADIETAGINGNRKDVGGLVANLKFRWC